MKKYFTVRPIFLLLTVVGLFTYVGFNPPVQAQIPLSPNFSAGITTPVYGTAVVNYQGTATSIAATANQRIYIYSATCVEGSSADNMARLIDGTTVLAYIPCPESKVNGYTVTFNPPLRWSVNSAVTVTTNIGQINDAGNIFVSVQGYKANQ